MIISILGNDYDFSKFPTQLQEALVEFSQIDVLDMDFDQYQALTNQLIDLACQFIEWDESEDNIISIEYPHYIELCLEGQDWAEFPSSAGLIP